MSRRPFAALLVLLLIPGLAGLAGPTAAAPPDRPDRPTTEWTPREADHPGTVTETDLVVPVSDGTRLRADVVRPAEADGTPVPGRFPVIVTITAYNKTALASDLGASLGGDSVDYLVRRGYVQVTVDARGTGSSEGVWRAFSERENRDAGEIVEWAASAERPWSDGRVGMSGPSYMGISQLFAASHRPEGLKAIFPQVPAADVYRDVVASGGALDVGFIPLWLGLVTATGVIPPAYGAADPQSAMELYFDRLTSGGDFTARMLLEATLGGEAAYDGPFYAERSPINVVDDIDVPTFLVGGHHDLFQRGTPLIFENLRSRGVPVKMILGPWDHLEASAGTGLADAGHGTLAELQLRWFDRHVKGSPDRRLDSDLAPLTWYEINSGRWRTAEQWIGDQQARVLQLSGTSHPGGAAGDLVAEDPQAGRSTVWPLPVSGLCTRSSNQWTAGIPNATGLADACTDEQWNDRSGLTFQTEPTTEPFRIRGPMNARLQTSSPSGNGMYSVVVSTVAPDGSVNRLAGGWQVLSHRALDEERSRYLDGELIQPHHPFTPEAQRLLEPGEVAPVDVEIFPTGAVVPAGHGLRVSVQAFDVPHLLPTLPDVLAAASPLTLHTSAERPSTLTLPTIPIRQQNRR